MRGGLPPGRAKVFFGTLDRPPILEAVGGGAVSCPGAPTLSIVPAVAPDAGSVPRAAAGAAKDTATKPLS